MTEAPGPTMPAKISDRPMSVWAHSAGTAAQWDGKGLPLWRFRDTLLSFEVGARRGGSSR